MDFLKSAVASAISKGPLGSYVIGEKVDFSDTIWSLRVATKRVRCELSLRTALLDADHKLDLLQDDNLQCSVFTFDVLANKSRLPLARNAVRKARTLHHPGVLKVFDTIEVGQPCSSI